ncbi:hypothetical protein GCM10010404_81700 [Nonomuraea africana]|uniref:Uncharacterized protein n=1 Tax=Nonomuraea africana TaxID=46171 RepID=A0ABR9KXU7_9ACTN|nr:hypothetical protein [Nonomuraea africana]MBE1566595.1 hypothetical protein [Nonomuraea africana]
MTTTTAEPAEPRSKFQSPAMEAFERSNGHGLYAQHIEVSSTSGGWSLVIDGSKFPYYLAPESWLPFDKDMPRLQVSLLACRVQLDNNVLTPDPGDRGEPWPLPVEHPVMGTFDLNPNWVANVRRRLGLADDACALAGLVQIRRHGLSWRMLIDGEEFPYLVQDAELVVGGRAEIAKIRLTIPAKRIQTDQQHQWRPVE